MPTYRRLTPLFRGRRADLDPLARQYNALTSAMVTSLAMARRGPNRGAQLRSFQELRQQQRQAAASLLQALQSRQRRG